MAKTLNLSIYNSDDNTHSYIVATVENTIPGVKVHSDLPNDAVTELMAILSPLIMDEGDAS